MATLPSVAPRKDRGDRSRRGFKAIGQKLRNIDGDPLLTSRQIDQLDDLMLDDRPLMSPSDPEFIMEMAYLINEYGFDEAYNFLSQDWDEIRDASRKYIMFESPTMQRLRQNMMINLEIYKRQIEFGKGVENCLRCNAEETLATKKQMRSADEPETIKVKCLQCGFEWTAQ